MRKVLSFFIIIILSNFFTMSICAEEIEIVDEPEYCVLRIDQKSFYPEKTIVSGIAVTRRGEIALLIRVNDKQIKSKIFTPEKNTGKFSLKVDFSACNIGDKIVFEAYFVDQGRIAQWFDWFKIKRKKLTVPNKPKIKKVKALGNGKIKVVLKKQKNISGYKIYYSATKKFARKKTKVKKSTSRKIILKGASSGKYYIKAQTFNSCKGSKSKYSKETKCHVIYTT